MGTQLEVYNSLTREKEHFEPIQSGHVGLYVCGPTVYSNVHLGNCRTFVHFDVIYRFLMYSGYKVRYVRNITDVGHLEGDADIGREDKIAKKARLEQLEPMEVVQRYANSFHKMMELFNVLPPSIEPRATGHIIEQIEMIQSILDRGFAYIKNGSVYFDTPAFVAAGYPYGKLSGRVIEELIQESRDDLKGQGDKNNPSDFALWIKADEKHLMKWPSPWSLGFPGWHLECSAMSTKYLGEKFDIHGGGNDLKFPHHENEIAQNLGACGNAPAKYWLHSNMLLMNGRKMAKSDGNTITPDQLFTGNSPHISKGYGPMVVRFFILQSHYRSTLDLSDHALQSAEKGLNRLLQAHENSKLLIGKSKVQTDLDSQILALLDQVIHELNDDFNTPKAIATLFELVPKINSLKSGKISDETISHSTITTLTDKMGDVLFTIFGLQQDGSQSTENAELVDGLMHLIIELRQDARTKKDWGTADKIRDILAQMSIEIKDNPTKTEWTIKTD